MIPFHPASFPDGHGTWMDFIARHMRYPDLALRQSLSRNVEAILFVETDGSLSFLKMKDEADHVYEAEVRRVINLMPPWIPALEEGKPVRSRISLQFPFLLSSAYRYDDIGSVNEIVLYPDQKAGFPGGNSAMQAFIEQKRGYSTSQGLYGVVNALVVIEANGQLSHPEEITTIGQVMAARGMEILSDMPDWIPAQKDGKVVRSQQLVIISL